MDPLKKVAEDKCLSFETIHETLKESEIVITKFGMHIIQLIDRKGEQINVRHILIKPKPNSYSKQQASEEINEIFNKINLNEITFNEAVQLYSDHPSKNNLLKINHAVQKKF